MKARENQWMQKSISVDFPLPLISLNLYLHEINDTMNHHRARYAADQKGQTDNDKQNLNNQNTFLFSKKNENQQPYIIFHQKKDHQSQTVGEED